MFLICWILRLVALPLLWAGRVVGWFSSGSSIPLLQAAWTLTGNGRIAQEILHATSKVAGSQAVLSQALVWMESRPRVEIAAMGGLAALEVGEAQMAAALLERAKELGSDRDGLVETLEWLLVARSDDPQAARRLARQYRDRRDLPAPVSRMVRIALMWDALLDGRFDEARERARHLLEIEDVPPAEVVLWALARREGDERAAQAHLRSATLPPAELLYYQILGSAAIADVAAARSLLEQLRAENPAAAEALERSAIGGTKEPVA